MRKIVVCLIAMLAFANSRIAAQAPFGQYSKQPWEAKCYKTSIDGDETPGTDWYQLEFDDSGWEQISGPISNTDAMYHTTRWEPEGTVYWVRRHFTLESIDTDKFYLLHVVHDDGCVMYLNGNLIYENGGVRGDTEYVLVFDQEKLSYLKEGDNLLALKVGNTGRGNAYMDFGIYAGNPVTELTLSHSAISVRKGARMSLEALVNEDAFDESLSWSIADGNVASVVEDGVIYGNNVGQTTLTVTSLSNPEVSATCQIYVYEPDALQWILPWGKDEAWSMRYRRYELADYEEPAADANGKRWTEAGYDDAAWETLSGPMASEGIDYSNYNYVWEGENNCYCLRRIFTMQPVEEDVYTFLMQHDDDIKVYLNGRLVIDEVGWTDERVSLYRLSSDAFLEGENTLAIYIQQNSGGAFLDYAIDLEKKATHLTLSEENLTLKINEEAQLTATVDGTTSGVCWSVADGTIVSVTAEGKVRGKKTGTTTITATAISNPSVTATCTVTVTSEYAPLATGWLQPMGEEYPWTMRYQYYELADTASPADDSMGLHWYEVGYDDAEWQTLVGPLGGTTPWEGDNNCYYLRGTFVLPENAHGSLQFYAKHDDGIRVYINGVMVRDHGYDMGLHEFAIPDTLLHQGDNTIAVYAQEEGGGAYFDYGLYFTEASMCTVTVTSEGGGTVHGGGQYKIGTEVTLTAIPDDGYRFVNWSNGSTDNSITFIVNGDVEMTALFEKIPVIAPGTILPWGKDEAWTVKYLFNETADSERPGVDANGTKWYEPNYDDSSWGTLTGPIGDKNDYNYQWVGENNCFFLRRTFHLSEIEDKSLSFYVNHDNGIEVYLNGQLVVKNAEWTHDENSLYKIPNETLVIGENTLAIYIKQEEGSTYLDYTLLFEDTRELEELYDSRIVAIPEGTYYVYYTDRDGNRRYLQAAGEDNWVVGDEPTVITFSEGNVTDTQAYAHAASFMESNGYYMSVVKSLDGIGPISTVAKDGEIGAQKRTWESQVFYRNEAGKYAIRLTNTVGADWKSNYFVNVNSITLDVAAGTPTLGEEFYIWQLEQTDSVPNPSIKNVSVKASQGGIVTGGGEYVVGTEVTLTAVPEEGYRFVGWSDGSTENPRTLMVETDVKLFAEFAPNSYVITYWVDGWLYGYYYVEYGAPIPSMKEPVKEGYTFIGWSDLPETMPAMDLNVYSIFVLNAQQTDSLGLNYSLNDSKDAFEFSGYTDSLQAEVIIPSEVHGIPVTTIGDGAFMGATDLKSIVIPSTVTTVGDKAFGGCSNLLVVEWNSSAPVKSECFDDPASHGNMLVFVPAGATVTFAGNVIIDGVAEQITLIDGMPLRNPRDFIAQRVEYSREFTKQTYLGTTSGWEALVLPFNVQRLVSANRGELKPFGEADFTTSLPYWLAEAQKNGAFASVDKITAGVPFIMQVPNSDDYDEEYNIEGTIIFSAQNTMVYATANAVSEMGGGYTFVGSYEGCDVIDDEGFMKFFRTYALNDEAYSADGEMYMPGGVFVADSRDIRPFEAYVYSNHTAPAPYLRIGGKGSTGIGHSTFKAQPSAIYDLMGRKVLKSEMLKKGIYIVNGKLNLEN